MLHYGYSSIDLWRGRARPLWSTILWHNNWRNMDYFEESFSEVDVLQHFWCVLVRFCEGAPMRNWARSLLTPVRKRLCGGPCYVGLRSRRLRRRWPYCLCVYVSLLGQYFGSGFCGCKTQAWRMERGFTGHRICSFPITDGIRSRKVPVVHYCGNGLRSCAYSRSGGSLSSFGRHGYNVFGDVWNYWLWKYGNL